MHWLIVTTDSDTSIPYFIESRENIDAIKYGDPLPSSFDYEVVYFRDPFNTGEYNIQVIQDMVMGVVKRYPQAYFVDGIKSYDELMIEDKWRQYEKLEAFMPPSSLLTKKSELNGEKIAKKRVSARARDIAFIPEDIDGEVSEYVLQDRLNITREYRVFSIGSKVLPITAVKSPKTPIARVKVQAEISTPAPLETFTRKILTELPEYDFLGFDIAETEAGYVLIEVNRSPQFKRYNEIGKMNIALDVIRHVEGKI